MQKTPLFHEAQHNASTLPPLLIEAMRIADSVSQGIHGRGRKGLGDNFWQFRPYQSGESTRNIDWRQSAKSDGYYVREREWDSAQTVWLWLDTSSSMRYSSDPKLCDKLHRAHVLLLALASLILQSGEQIALLGQDFPPSKGRTALYRLARLLEKQTHEKNHASGLQSLPAHAHLPRYGELVLIGDFLSRVDEIESAIKKYSRRHVRGHLLQVLDPAEETLPFEGRITFKGMENEGQVHLGDVGRVREQYQARLRERRHLLRALTQSLGWGFHRHTTDYSSQSALLALYMSLRQRREG